MIKLKDKTIQFSEPLNKNFHIDYDKNNSLSKLFN